MGQVSSLLEKLAHRCASFFVVHHAPTSPGFPGLAGKIVDIGGNTLLYELCVH